jgi:hypothetical protein
MSNTWCMRVTSKSNCTRGDGFRRRTVPLRREVVLRREMRAPRPQLSRKWVCERSTSMERQCSGNADRTWSRNAWQLSAPNSRTSPMLRVSPCTTNLIRLPFRHSSAAPRNPSSAAGQSKGLILSPVAPCPIAAPNDRVGRFPRVLVHPQKRRAMLGRPLYGLSRSRVHDRSGCWVYWKRS